MNRHLGLVNRHRIHARVCDVCVWVSPHVELQPDARPHLEILLQCSQASALLLILQLLNAQCNAELHLAIREDRTRLVATYILAKQRLEARKC